jgi:hypothetical protein
LLSNAFGGLVAAGILSGLNNARGLHAWQWVCFDMRSGSNCDSVD